MVTIQREYERYGRLWRVPQACETGRRGERARWISIRDGLRTCIEFLPMGHRAVESRLQSEWMYAANQVEMLIEESGGEWLIPV